MKKLTRIVSFVLSVAMLFSVTAGVDLLAIAGGSSKTEVVSIYDGLMSSRANNGWDSEDYYYHDVIVFLSKEFASFSKKIDISRFGLNVYQVHYLMNYLVFYKQFYYISSYTSNYASNGDVLSVVPNYTMSRKDVEYGNKLINDEISAIVRGASKFSSDIEKIIYVHDYILDRLEPDLSGNFEHDNIYYAVRYGKAGCIGYAVLFNNVLRLYGINSDIVISEENGCVWNYIRMTDHQLSRNYYVSCFDDDFGYEQDNLLTNPISGTRGYSYFMCNANTLLKNGYSNRQEDWTTTICLENVSDAGWDNSFYDLLKCRNCERVVAAGDYVYVAVAENIDESGSVIENASPENAGFTIYQIKFYESYRKYEVINERKVQANYIINDIETQVYYPVIQAVGGVLYYKTNEGIFAYNPNSDKDECVFKSTEELNIYDFLMEPEMNTLSVMYGNRPDDKGVLRKYKLSDYLCKNNNHTYSEWVEKNGYLVKSCVNCMSESKSLQFSDLDNFVFYGDFIEYTSDLNKFILGTNPDSYTLFSPKKAITRAMFVTILYRMAGEPYKDANPYTVSPFNDIKDTGVYYYDAACWALDNGITTEKTFKPYDDVTRQQTAAFLFRYAKDEDSLGDDTYKSIELPQKYYDYVTIRPWAEEAMQWANYNGMITGTLNGAANPQGSTLRIHATKILYGFGKTCNIGSFE